jgi:predicted transcriptional regulator
MDADTKLEKRALARFLFHLGKGLWKSVPLIGPLVDEVVYTQYESKLLQKMDGLSEEDLRRIVEALPKLNEQALVERLRKISMDTQIVSLTHFSRVLDDIHTSHTDVTAGILGVSEKLDDLPTILAMIREVRQRIEDRSAIEKLLVEYENRRQAWIARISVNQRKLLEQIPETFAAAAVLWDRTLSLLPGCGYKEFRFRLHELEWIGLVERRRVPAGTWEYRRAASSRS